MELLKQRDRPLPWTRPRRWWVDATSLHLRLRETLPALKSRLDQRWRKKNFFQTLALTLVVVLTLALTPVWVHPHIVYLNLG